MISHEFQLIPLDNRRLANLCGTLDVNLKEIATRLDVTISHRGERFLIKGGKQQSKFAEKVVRHFYSIAVKHLGLEEIQLGLIEASSQAKFLTSEKSVGLKTRKRDLRGRTPRQVQYLEQMKSNDITFGIGPAGTGKTYLAVASAVDAFENGLVKRIILVRPAVEAGERLGFLPGDLAQKVDPYLRPLYDALYDLMGFEKASKLFEKGTIEIAPLAYMRGRTLNHSFIILDEAQNTTSEQMKMFLTRIGFSSRVVVTGDITQIDLPKHQKSGLVDAKLILSKVEEIAFTNFLFDDVVRHPLVQRIVQAYEKHGKIKTA